MGGGPFTLNVRQSQPRAESEISINACRRLGTMSPKGFRPLPLFHPRTPVNVNPGRQKLVRRDCLRTPISLAECLERTPEYR